MDLPGFLSHFERGTGRIVSIVGIGYLLAHEVHLVLRKPRVDEKGVGHDSRPDYPDDKQESVGAQRAWHNRMERNLAQVRFDNYQLVEYAEDKNAREEHEKLLYYVESSCHHRHQQKDVECAEDCSVQ